MSSDRAVLLEKKNCWSSTLRTKTSHFDLFMQLSWSSHCFVSIVTHSATQTCLSSKWGQAANSSITAPSRSHHPPLPVTLASPEEGVHHSTIYHLPGLHYCSSWALKWLNKHSAPQGSIDSLTLRWSSAILKQGCSSVPLVETFSYQYNVLSICQNAS